MLSVDRTIVPPLFYLINFLGTTTVPVLFYMYHLYPFPRPSPLHYSNYNHRPQLITSDYYLFQSGQPSVQTHDPAHRQLVILDLNGTLVFFFFYWRSTMKANDIYIIGEPYQQWHVRTTLSRYVPGLSFQVVWCHGLEFSTTTLRCQHVSIIWITSTNVYMGSKMFSTFRITISWQISNN